MHTVATALWVVRAESKMGAEQCCSTGEVLQVLHESSGRLIGSNTMGLEVHGENTVEGQEATAHKLKTLM